MLIIIGNISFDEVVGFSLFLINFFFFIILPSLSFNELLLFYNYLIILLVMIK